MSIKLGTPDQTAVPDTASVTFAATDWSDCPLVEINPRKLSGVPVLKGTRMQADSIVQNYRSGLAADEIAEVFELPLESVRSLLAYSAEHRAIFKP